MTASPLLLLADGPMFKQHILLNVRLICYDTCNINFKTIFISDFILEQIRWIVESSNARIKKWRYLDRTLPTNQIPFVGNYVRIVFALSNKFFPPLGKSPSIEEDETDACKMLYLPKQVRLIRVLSQHWKRRHIYRLPFYRAYPT